MKLKLTHEARHLMWAILIAFDVAVLFIVITVTEASAGLYAGIAAVSLLTIIPGLFFVHGLSRSAYQITPEGLTIHRRVGALHILFQNILRMDRQQKTASGKGDSVRITFWHYGGKETIEVTPECSKSFVSDIRRYCPQLTSSKKMVLVRDASFEAAGASLREEPDHAARTRDGDPW
jgi:hypothetical protein